MDVNVDTALWTNKGPGIYTLWYAGFDLAEAGARVAVMNTVLGQEEDTPRIARCSLLLVTKSFYFIQGYETITR
jgi:hypothetical protein